MQNVFKIGQPHFIDCVSRVFVLGIIGTSQFLD